MAEEKKAAPEAGEEPEESRGEFLGKAAGTLGIAGMVASLFNSEADAQLTSDTGGGPQIRAIEGLNLTTQRLGNTRTFNLSGKNLAASLGREGLIPGGENAAEVGVGFSVKF